MSSLHMDASGTRSLSFTVNDQQRTVAGMPSRNDDDVTVQINSCAELRFMLPPNARLERRRYASVRVENGERVETGEFYEHVVVVIGDRRQKGGHSLFIVGRNVDREAQPDAYGNMPAVIVSARKGVERQFTESGDVVAASDLDTIELDPVEG